MKGKVIVEGDLIRLWADGQFLDGQQRENLDHIYLVFAGSALGFPHPDTDFHVFAFVHKIWVLPYKTAGVSEVMDQVWRDYISQAKIFRYAYLSEIPQHWRKRLLGGLIRPPEPRLLVLPSTDLPTWEVQEPSSHGRPR